MDKPSSIPKTIGGYRIIEVLGEGGMSVVYTAMQEHPKRKVAIKVLRGGMYSPTAAKRFHQEVEILGRLDHPWIGKIYDAGTHDEGNGATPYYVMECVEGARELTEYIEQTELTRRDVIKLFAMIASAVEHGHHRGVVHRDLKPGNILIDKEGEPKIIDFGVARSLDRTTVGEEAMTEAGRLVGTVQFMAPEQVDATITDIDARCDVYALGAVLFQMLTGRLPRTLEGLPIYEAVRQICKEQPVRPTIYDSSIDQDLEAIVMMALETNREKRYQTAGAFGRDILRYLGNRTIKARKASAFDHIKLFTRRHKLQISIAGGIVVLLGMSLAAVLMMRADSNQQIDDLQAQILETNEAELERQQQEALRPEVSAEEEQDAKPILTLDTPTKLVVSTSGTMLAYVAGDDYTAKTITGQSVQLPAINIEPSTATLQLSMLGTRLAIVSGDRGRIVSLHAQKPTVQLSGDFENLVAVALSEQSVAVSLADMSLRVIGVQGKLARALSNTGEFEAVAFSSTGEHIVAATDFWVYVWSTQSFPKNVTPLKGVQNPCCIGVFSDRIVVVGSDGEVRIHESNGETKSSAMGIGAEITNAALNTETTLLGCIANGVAYTFSLSTQELVELTWMPEEPVGIAIGKDNAVILWTAGGNVYSD
ncbi:MAG: protein kinase [Phycisphaerae bacterium]|nr:protein kinase [Phycisphaerae bacterium]